MINSIIRVVVAVFVILLLAAFSCSTNFSSATLPPETSSLSTSDCPDQQSEDDDDFYREHVFEREDWFRGRVEVPADEDVSGIRLVELNPVYSLPDNTNLNFYFSGDADLSLGLVLQLRNHTGTCVLSKPLYASKTRTYTMYDIPRFLSSLGPVVEIFSTKVADPPDYASFAIKAGDKELAVVQLSEHAPTVAFPSFSEGQVFEDQVSISWTGHDQDGDELAYKVFRSYGPGGYWHERTITDYKGTQWDFLDFRADRDDRVAIAVSDGTRSTFAVTPVFQVAERNPEVTIVSPVSGTTYYGQQEFRLWATSSDADKGRRYYRFDDAYSWSSSIDGPLGTGTSINITADQLTPGNHIITIVVTDETGLTGTDSIPITIHKTKPDTDPGVADWFTGTIGVPLSSDEILFFQLKTLNPVYSLPKKASLKGGAVGWWDMGLTLELRDSAGASIQIIPFYITDIPPGLFIELPFSESITFPTHFKIAVPDPPEYASFAIKAGDRELAVVERSAHAPTVTIQGITENQVFRQDEEVSVLWQGHDQDDDTLTYRVFQSHDAGQTWHERTDRYTAKTQWSDFKFQATDQARIAIAASDGTRSTFAMTPVFQVKLQPDNQRLP